MKNTKFKKSAEALITSMNKFRKNDPDTCKIVIEAQEKLKEAIDRVS